MPRRPTPLDHSDGPVARFAIQLRALRDAAGENAPSIDRVALQNQIARSTVYAVMQGKRLPNRDVLAAIVKSWGDAASIADWMSRRSAVEAELERARLAHRSFHQSLSTSRRPDPVLEPQVKDFVAALADARRQAGDPSLRQIAQRGAERTGYVTSHTSLSHLLRGRGTPIYSTVDYFLYGCGVDDPKAWRDAWERKSRYRPWFGEESAGDVGRPG